MAKQTILIIDDNEEKRETLVDYVLMLGHETVEAENGLLGLAEARLRHPDLILLDLSMPQMNGMQFLEARKNDPTVKQIPVIIITARDSSEICVADCIQQGAEDILPMPPEYEILKARIGNCLERVRQRKSEMEMRGQMETLLLEKQDAVRKADRLLRSIFPRDAVKELQATNDLAPRRHDDVAVLFCDIVGFTTYCDSHDPDEVVRNLELLVEGQEDISERLGVEKIKTIGDCFMAAVHLNQDDNEVLLNCIRCGLEFIELPKTLKLGWEVRVGMHVGPIVAGKLGNRKFTYDLWGDTVNTASRIQTAASPDSLFVSDAVWQRVKENCTGESQGPHPIKGKGEMELVRVLSVPALVSAQGAK